MLDLQMDHTPFPPVQLANKKLLRHHLRLESTYASWRSSLDSGISLTYEESREHSLQVHLNPSTLPTSNNKRSNEALHLMTKDEKNHQNAITNSKIKKSSKANNNDKQKNPSKTDCDVITDIRKTDHIGRIRRRKRSSEISESAVNRLGLLDPHREPRKRTSEIESSDEHIDTEIFLETENYNTFEKKILLEIMKNAMEEEKSENVKMKKKKSRYFLHDSNGEPSQPKICSIDEDLLQAFTLRQKDTSDIWGRIKKFKLDLKRKMFSGKSKPCETAKETLNTTKKTNFGKKVFGMFGIRKANSTTKSFEGNKSSTHMLSERANTPRKSAQIRLRTIWSKTRSFSMEALASPFTAKERIKRASSYNSLFGNRGTLFSRSNCSIIQQQSSIRNVTARTRYSQEECPTVHCSHCQSLESITESLEAFDIENYINSSQVDIFDWHNDKQEKYLIDSDVVSLKRSTFSYHNRGVDCYEISSDSKCDCAVAYSSLSNIDTDANSHKSYTLHHQAARKDICADDVIPRQYENDSYDYVMSTLLCEDFLIEPLNVTSHQCRKAERRKLSEALSQL